MIEVRQLSKTFAGRGGLLGHDAVHALREVNLSLPDGGAVSIIGESGCGKTTLGRILCGFESYDSGSLLIEGHEAKEMHLAKRREHFQRIQLIHQDPYSALNPTRTVRQTMLAALRLRGSATARGQSWAEQRAAELLELVGLDPSYCLPRYPHMLSGGMRQRVVIARALTADPEVLVADEAVAMIDVSLRLGILGLLRRLRSELGLSLLFITHDVAAARYVGEDGQLYVLYRGQVVEQGPVDEIVQRPFHPYTQCLLSAIPVMRGLERPGRDRLVPLRPLDDKIKPSGCILADRCPQVQDDCLLAQPPLVPADGEGHLHACLHPETRSVVARPEKTA